MMPRWMWGRMTGERGGAEELRDGGEAAPEGAMLDGVGEVAAVGGEDAGDVEDFRDARGHGPGVAVLCGIGRGGKAGVRVAVGFIAVSITDDRC